MKQVKIFYLCLLLSHTIFSNHNKSNYNTAQDLHFTKQNKPIQLKSLVHLIDDTKDSKSFKDFTLQYLELAFKQDKHSVATSKILSLCSRIEMEFNDPDFAILLLNKLEEHTNKINDTYLLGGIYQKKARAYYDKSNFTKAYKNCNISIKNYGYTVKDSLYKADAIFLKGQILVKTNNFIDAIKNYELASVYYENLNDLTYTFFIKTAIISIYTKIGLNEIAIEKLLNIIAKKKSLKYNIGLTSNYYNLAINYKEVGNIKNYKTYLDKALAHKEKSNDNDGFIPYYQTAIAKYYIQYGKLSQAEIFLKKAALEIKTDNANSISKDFFNKIKCFYLYKNHQPKSALELAQKTLLEIEKQGDLASKKELNKLIFDIYTDKNDAKNALKYYQFFTKIKDSITNINSVSVVNYYQTLSEKEKEEQLQNNKIIHLKKKNKTKKELLIAIIIFIVLLLIIIYLYWNRLLSIKEKKIQINYSQKLLLAQEEQRKRISKDLHDGLGHSLLLIKHKITSIKDKSLEKLINDAIEEMRSISRVLYPFQLKGIGLTSALDNLMRKLDDNSETFIFGDIDNIDNILTVEQEVNVFRIIQECLTNIIKHADASSARVTLKLIKKHHIYIIIQDNGIGFNYIEKLNDNKSLGLKTINQRVDFLKGSLKVCCVKKNETVIKILFPLK
ncbi:hypothetical protein KO506_00015 [Polaribacter vadi]|uniref:tetratricopeptide repeat-containing sensor histidine kinase n=1 Tax=Polaribacter TaxID=52959 RepID=UPI001C09955B|nr:MULTISPECIES: ATP-binding protein [Polaribacter]MBU3009784.1 hypothetical protein [Polaribacter vadi]MDO6739589.1 histidine kinase [Polaribacter sp. 1_MG-2023]